MRAAVFFLTLVSVVTSVTSTSPLFAQLATEGGSPENNAILIADVVDDETGEPISTFISLPGVSRINDNGFRWQWQPHKIHAFKGGQLLWPPPGDRAYSTDQALRIEAEGYLPFETPTIKQPDQRNSEVRASNIKDQPPELVPPLVVTPGKPTMITIRLKRDPGITGHVVDADGKPLEGATVAIGTGNHRNLHLHHGDFYFWPQPKPNESLTDLWVRPRHTKTDSDGRFSLPSEIERARIAAAHPYGFATTSYDNFQKSGVMRLQAWGRIEGRAVWNGKPAVGEKIRLFASHLIDDAITDADGRFSFDKVPPGDVGLGRDSVPPGDWNGVRTNPNGRVEVPPGKSVKCVLGGRGRPIIGKVNGYKDWRNVSVSVHLDLHWPSQSFRIPDDPTLPAFSNFISSEFYRHYDQPPFGIKADSTFRLDRVPAEQYAIVVTERDGDAFINRGQAKFCINLMPTGESDEPQDVGTIEISPNGRVTSQKIEP